MENFTCLDSILRNFEPREALGRWIWDHRTMTYKPSAFYSGRQTIKGLGLCARLVNPRSRTGANLTRVVHDLIICDHAYMDNAGTHLVLATAHVKAFHGFALVELKRDMKTGVKHWAVNTFTIDAWCNRFKAFPRTFKA